MCELGKHIATHKKTKAVTPKRVLKIQQEQHKEVTPPSRRHETVRKIIRQLPEIEPEEVPQFERVR